MESLDTANHRPSKRQHLVHEDDTDWLKQEFDDVRELVMLIADHIRTEVDVKLEDILYEVQQLSQI